MSDPRDSLPTENADGRRVHLSLGSGVSCAGGIALAGLMLLAPASLGQGTTRVSVDSAGGQGNDNSQQALSISADGRFAAFSSAATNIVPGDTNGFLDVFVRDCQGGTTERVSIDSGGVQGNNTSYGPSISADGRFVAFQSYAYNLVANDGNFKMDIFVRDRQLGSTERVSVDSGGTEANGESTVARISADGRFVAFSSVASNLVLGDTNGLRDIFVRDRQTGVTERVSVDSAGAESNGFYVGPPSISADGRYVAFGSSATDLVAGDTNGQWDSFVHDRQTGMTYRVSVSSAGTEQDGSSNLVSTTISADGRFVAFSSSATNLVAGDTNGTPDVFLRDRLSGTTERISVSTTGQQGDGDCLMTSISVDGRFVAFMSYASNLVPGDSNATADIFVRDRQVGTTVRASVSTTGAQANNGASELSISADARFVAFSSASTNLVAGDTNGFWDVFVRDRGMISAGADLCQPGTSGVAVCPCSNPPANSPRGCDNSSATGGAQLTSSGFASLTSDALVFATNGERPTAPSILLQGDAEVTGGIAFGQGVRCVGGQLKRLYVKTASGGSITAPAAGDLSVSARSAALGDTISAGTSRWYAVYYRDPVVLGGCPASSGFNITQTQLVNWGL